MKKKLKWNLRTVISAMAALSLMTGVVLAASTAGGSKDPLVSYSYFTQTILPSLLSDVEDEAEGVADDLRDDLDGQIADYTADMEKLADEAIAQGAGSTGGDGAYQVMTLTPGQTLTLNAGDEVMLRIGSATVSGGSPALINTTEGAELANGGSLVTNHLYLCTIDGRTLTAGSAETWILVRS